MPLTSTSLRGRACPAITATADRGTCSAAASNSSTAWLALPRSGAAVTETLSTSPSQPVTALRDALGLTFTASRAILASPAFAGLLLMRSSLPCATRLAAISAIGAIAVVAAACTQETQNQLGRKIQNWTGTDGVLEVYAGDKLVKRFLHIEKISTAYGTDDSQPRPYRFGHGVLDENLNGVQDPGEKKVYFEISDYSTNYVFYEAPR